MKKAIQMLILLMCSAYSIAQTDSIGLDEMKLEILKTNKFYEANQLDLRGYDFSNAGLNDELYAAAISREKSNKRATTGGILIVAGFATFIAAGAVSSDDPLDDLGYFAGGFMLSTTAILLSIPFFINSGKHKRDAKKRIQIAREMYGG